MDPPVVGFLFSQDFVVHKDFLWLWNSLAQPGLVAEDSLGKLSPGGVQKGRFWGFLWKEGVDTPAENLSWVDLCSGSADAAVVTLTLQSQSGSI